MTTKKKIASLTLMFLLTTVQVSAHDMNSTVNTMLDGWARPIYLAGMLIGLIAGLVRNYDNIAAKNDNGNRMDGVIAVVWMVGYGLAGSVVINAIRTAVMGINLSV